MSVVDRALWFIEGHFARCPSLGEIAEASGTTRFHLSRSFRWATGRSVMAYTRGRRLTEACKTLSNGASSILSVALDSGYGSHEAFTRAFRDQFGLTPEQVRDGKDVDTSLLVEPIRMSDTRNIELKQPRIEHRGAITIAGLGAQLRLEEAQNIPRLWQEFQRYEGTLGEMPGEWYGVCAMDSADAEKFLYIAGVAVLLTDDLPPELRLYRFPAQDYLVFTHEGHISQLQQTMSAIFGHYLPESGQDTTGMERYFELYDDKFDPVSGLGGLELWMPIIKKT